MNDITDIFRARACERREYGADSPEMMKTSLKVKQANVNVADYIAKELGITRQEVLATVIDEGIMDALKGLCDGLGFTPGEFEDKFNSLTSPEYREIHGIKEPGK